MLSVKPLSFTEIMDSLSVSTGHLNYYFESLGELISKNQEGKYQLSVLGVAALNLLRDVEEAPPRRSRKQNNSLILYTVIACIILLSLSAYCLTYEKLELAHWPPLEQSMVGDIPFIIKPNQSLTVHYNITYKENGIQFWARNATFLFYDRIDGPPANGFETHEVDLAGYYTSKISGNGTFQVKVYSPSDKLLNEGFGTVDCGLVWPVEEPGAYRIVITNLSPTEPLKFKGGFQFTRNIFHKPFMDLGYITLLVGLIPPMAYLINTLNRKYQKKKMR